MAENHSVGTRDLFVSLSVANLAFVEVWQELLYPSLDSQYWIPDYDWKNYLAALINLAALSGVCFVALRWFHREPKNVLSYVGLAVLLVLPILVFTGLRRLLRINEDTLHWFTDHAIVSAVLASVAVVLALLICFRWRSKFVGGVYVILLICSPAALMSGAYSLWFCINLSGTDNNSATATAPQNEPRDEVSQRVVLLIFDELDLRLGFLEPPPGVELPEFDRIRAQSVFTTEGTTIADATLHAIPSMTLGFKVSAQPDGRARLRVTGAENETEGLWHELPNVFSEARLAGARTSIIGYYHPYCRIFADDCVRCTATSMGTVHVSRENSLSDALVTQLYTLTPIYRRRGAVLTYQRILSALLRDSVDTELDFVYAHIPVPHGPNIYDRRTGQLTRTNVAKDGYFDNLVLADLFLGKIRRAMEAAGVWDSTAIVLTADHDWRHVHMYDGNRTYRVPFLVKLPGQTTTVSFDEPFSPVLTKDLVLAILKRSFDSPDGVVRWLEEHR